MNKQGRGQGQSGGGGRGRGQGQRGGGGSGRGQGQRGGGRGEQVQAIKNLERAAADVQKMLENLTTSPQPMSRGKAPNTNKKGCRGSQSMTNLTSTDCRQFQRPPRQDPHVQGPQQCSYNKKTHQQGSYKQGPRNQGSYNQRPLQQPTSYNQGPHQQGLYNQGPHQQGPYDERPHQQQTLYNQGPHQQGLYNQGPHQQGLYNQGPHQQGPYYPYPYQAPPPSYEDSIQQLNDPPIHQPQTNIEPTAKGKQVQQATALTLVKELALFDGQLASAERLSRQLQTSIEEVETAVKQRKDIFSHMRDGPEMLIELVPRIRLCSQYLSKEGCTARNQCKDLHLCKDYILAYCDQGPSCSFGHKFDTNHNTSILSKMYLDLIEKRPLINVIRKVCRGSAPPKICSYYNSEGCKKMDGCRFLHICKEYVMNDGVCKNKNCSYNHQLTIRQCKNVLTQHGISTNETIRDILANLKLSLETPKQPHSDFGQMKLGDKKQSACSNDGEDDNSSDSDCSGTSAKTSVRRKVTKNPDIKAKRKTCTIRSIDVYGEVEIPEICIYSVNDKCINEKKGCKYLHAKSLFHWQFEKEKTWYNFRIFQSKALESAYRDVSKNGMKLPPIDADKVSSQDNKILEILGTDSWTADFKNMCIIDSAQGKLTIRRISTPSSAVSSMSQATVFEWYFADEKGKWIRYGCVDSLGKQDLVCNITCEDIEKQFLSDPSTMIISNTHYKYKIDFKQMTQINLTSNKVREIRRRPARLSYQKGLTQGGDDRTLPAHWKPMTQQQTHILVPLDSSHAEYQDVAKRVKLMIPTAKIEQIQRLQNEYLWRLFQLKKTDLSQRYNEEEMNTQKLFHGTDASFIDAICKENIDGRRYTNIKEKYGKGSYFSNSPAIARTHCNADANEHLYLVLAEVIIGLVTQGSKGINRPPMNTITGHQYDTTVDNMQAPTLFVKYDKEEYYPEYIIEFVV